MNRSDLKAKVVHELKEYLTVVLFLVPFLASLATYQMYSASDSRSALYHYGTALVNALVLAKIILIGDLAGLAKRYENRPLIIPILHKAFMFTILALAFHAAEATVHDMVQGLSFLGALHAIAGEKGQMGRLGLVMFFAFIPFFALDAMRRVVGADRFQHLLFGGTPPRSVDAGAGCEQQEVGEGRHHF